MPRQKEESSIVCLSKKQKSLDEIVNDPEYTEVCIKYAAWDEITSLIESIIDRRRVLREMRVEPEQYTPEQRGEIGRILSETDFVAWDSPLKVLEAINKRLALAVLHYNQ